MIYDNYLKEKTFALSIPRFSYGRRFPIQSQPTEKYCLVITEVTTGREKEE